MRMPFNVIRDNSNEYNDKFEERAHQWISESKDTLDSMFI